MNVEIQKGKGIEGLVGYVEVDETRQILAEPIFEEVEEVYKIGLECPSDDLSDFYVLQVLTPGQINSFLQTTIRYEEHQNYSNFTGLFISRLIQNSYDHGHNNFTLTTTALKKMHKMGCKIKGMLDKPIETTIIGDTGSNCGVSSINSTYNITGNTGNDCGWRSKNSIFNITGNTGTRCGLRSVNSTYNITGNVGERCGAFSESSTYHITGNTEERCGSSSESSTYHIAGNTGSHCGEKSIYSTYKTSNKETLKKIMEVPQGNRIIFIHPDGTEEIVRDYDKR